MSPTPITLIENNMASSLSRWTWDTTDNMDPKPAIGGHLSLGKRNSTPVGIGTIYNPQKLTQMAPSTNLNGLAGGVGEHTANTNGHRSVDRCHSEPLKHQMASAVTSSRYKTELCRPYAETGFCKYGEKCQFAHGNSELRNMPRHPKYKTEYCKTFHSTGLCGYGTRCHFIHNKDERRINVNFGNFSVNEDVSRITPPGSIQGSPSSGGMFFGDTFSLANNNFTDLQSDDSKFSMLALETPPVSPVESLAGDFDSLSLSLSSPSPPLAPSHHSALSAIMDNARCLRLPIFESLVTLKEL